MKYLMIASIGFVCLLGLTRCEDSFRAGVQSAINAHLTYIQSEMISGRIPPLAGMPVREWEKQARLVWSSHEILP